MKTTANIRKNLIAAVMVLSALSFTACSGSDSNDVVSNTVEKEVVKAENTFSFKIKALSQNDDITTKGELRQVGLYIFDQNNDFVKKENVDVTTLCNRRTISVSCPGSDRITVIALGGLNGSSETVPSMNTANIISDLTVSLKQNNGIANLPSDMFYGQLTLTQTKSDDVAVLNVERKVSSMDFVIAGIAKKFGTTEGDFYVKVKQAKSGLNYNGEFTDGQVEYIIPAYVTATGMITTDRVTVLPSDNVVVELYRNDVKVFSMAADKNGKNLTTTAGGQLYVEYNVASASSYVRVTAYNTVVSVVNVG